MEEVQLWNWRNAKVRPMYLHGTSTLWHYVKLGQNFTSKTNVKLTQKVSTPPSSCGTFKYSALQVSRPCTGLETCRVAAKPSVEDFVLLGKQKSPASVGGRRLSRGLSPNMWNIHFTSSSSFQRLFVLFERLPTRPAAMSPLGPFHHKEQITCLHFKYKKKVH